MGSKKKQRKRCYNCNHRNQENRIREVIKEEIRAKNPPAEERVIQLPVAPRFFLYLFMTFCTFLTVRQYFIYIEPLIETVGIIAFLLGISGIQHSFKSKR